MTRVVKRTINIMLVCQFLICLGMSLIFPGGAGDQTGLPPIGL